MFDRRQFLVGGGAAGALLAATAFPNMAVARARTDRRFIFVLQRGGADGLSILAPTGDPGFGSVRRAFAGESLSGPKIDGFFTLHSELKETAKLYSAREALFVHATALPTRRRSHFDAQNLLETGGLKPYQHNDGWMNRLLTLLPRDQGQALALAPAIPLILRGPHAVSSFAPSALPGASDDLMMRVSAMYEQDPQLHAVWSRAVATRTQAGDISGGRMTAGAMGQLAAKLLKGGDGARIALIESNHWDTHAGQRTSISTRLRHFDNMVGALKSGLGPAWANTLVIAATEFGRTVAPNGTGGTDHGTGGAAMLFGGAVEGGKVIADWPGLAPS
nr:DUF1501 domain-containing protein [Sphingomonas sp.]